MDRRSVTASAKSVLRRRRPQVLLASVLVLAAVVALAVALTWRDPQAPLVQGRDVYPAGGPRPPGRGAWFGAYVEPAANDHTQQGQTAAVTDYERRLGGALDLVRTYYPWKKDFPREIDRRFANEGRILLIGWGGTDIGSIVSGRHDALIRARARAVKRLGTPILLSWRGEMDRPNLRDEVGPRQRFIAAWRRIRAIFYEEGTSNVGWVWCPTAEGFDAGRAGDFYPGDGQVDWLCADGYAYPSLRPPETIFGSFFRWARGHDKPIVIGEYGAEDNNGARAGWLRSFGAAVQRNPQVKAIAYFDKNHQHNKNTIMYYSLRGFPSSMEALRQLASTPYFDPGHRRGRG